MNSDGGLGASTDAGRAARDATADARSTGADAAGGDDAGGDATGYVHRPAAETPSNATADDDVADATTGIRGWVLVGVVVTCFLVVPVVIYLRPAVPGQFGLTFLAAMLALPMLPALILGLTAVWSMKGPRDDE